MKCGEEGKTKNWGIKGGLVMKSLGSLKNLKDHKNFELFNVMRNIQRSKSVSEPLSEFDILDLQDKFLTNGFHYINVSTISFGRSLVSRFLKSLHCYNDNAVLSLATPVIDENVTDIYYELIQGGFISFSSENDLDEFFVNQFYYDFMWIEACNHLVDSAWFTDFFGKMVSYKLDQHIPVLILSYR